jgi:AhpD family alkylhydroperoxidase
MERRKHTMKLDARTMRLIAVGASIAANCQQCLEINVTGALEGGIGEDEIAQAIDVGKRVRQGAATKMDRFAASLSRNVPSLAGIGDSNCGCAS